MAIRTEEYLGQDRSWIASDIGVNNAKTSVARAAAFTGTHIKSGTPVKRVNNRYEPYLDGDRLAGFVLTDVALNGDANVPFALHWIGAVHITKIPVTPAFVPPTAANDDTRIAYRR